MAIEIKNIQQLIEANPSLNSPIIFGDGVNLRRTTIQEILTNFVDQGITEINVNNTFNPNTFFESGGNIIVPSEFNSAIQTNKNELRFFTVNIVNTDNGTASKRTYLFQPDVFMSIGARLNNANTVLINVESTVISGGNTVTYEITDLDDINQSVEPFDFTDSDISYFVRIGSELYAFQGENGEYGLNDLTLEMNDLVLISGFQPLDFDTELSTTSTNGVENQAVGSEFERTNFLGREIQNTITSLNQVTKLNYNLICLRNSNNVFIDIDFALPEDFNLFGFVEAGKITFLETSGANVINSTGESELVVETGEHFHLGRLDDKRFYLRIWGAGTESKQVFVIDDGSNLTLDGSRDAVVINDSNSIINVDIPLPTNDNKGREFTFTAVEDRILLNTNFMNTEGSLSNIIFEAFSYTIISTGTRYQLISAIM